MLPGHHEVLAPHIIDFTMRYSNRDLAWDSSLPAHDFGYLDLRHRAKAVTAMFDGHAQTLGLPTGRHEQLRDMRHWSNWATRATWRPGQPMGR